MFLLSYCLYLTLSEQDGLFWKVVGGKAQQEIERQMSIIFILFLSSNNVLFCFFVCKPIKIDLQILHVRAK